MDGFKSPRNLKTAENTLFGGRLRDLVRHATHIDEWNREIEPKLPERLRHQIRLLNLRDGIAIFGCRDGLGHHLVRWHERQLRKLLESASGQPVRAVKARVVNESMHQPQPPSSKPRRIGPAAGDHLQRLADNESDPHWRELLSSLASHSRKR